ncbi:MAG TPA: glucosamine-6-phosphate deaminase [Bacilli bacterium]|nr:glucosamine-6-phosphate deaminase [Bacilli bacterium]HQA55473.1 glucosamine-6-phosphate deaminase [Bacilli bacterium]
MLKIIVGSGEEISRLIAEQFILQIQKKPDSVLGLATGTSPLGVYRNLIEANKKKVVSFSKVTTFNLDEYIGLEGTHNQSYRYFMNVNLFDHIDIDKKNTFVLKGVGDYLAYANNYDNLIEEHGGIDLQILGIGSNGHIAFNEPDTPFDSLTHIADLNESTIKDNSRLFSSIKEVPTKAVTMGLKSIMNARKIVLIAMGKSKAEAVKNLIKGKISKRVPSSILRNHPDVTIYVDQDAYSLVNK